MTSEIFKDHSRIAKLILDKHQKEKFNYQIAYATEYNQAVKLTVGDGGYTYNITSRVHYINPITRELRIEVKPGEFERVAFASVVRVRIFN